MGVPSREVGEIDDLGVTDTLYGLAKKIPYIGTRSLVNGSWEVPHRLKHGGEIPPRRPNCPAGIVLVTIDRPHVILKLSD